MSTDRQIDLEIYRHYNARFYLAFRQHIGDLHAIVDLLNRHAFSRFVFLPKLNLPELICVAAPEVGFDGKAYPGLHRRAAAAVAAAVVVESSTCQVVARKRVLQSTHQQ